MVFIREKALDPTELEAYWSKVGPTPEGRPVKMLATYGMHVTLERPAAEGIVVAEFPSLERARAWYDSPADREGAEYRFRGAMHHGLIVEGV
jgi:uncharacterized protein (DUF1330 family)